MAPQNVVVCKWSINGDFLPTRYVNQLEAAKAIITQITSNNPESKAALINLASKRLIRSFSSSTEYLVEKLSNLECEGDVDLIKSLQIANLVLNNSTDERVIKQIVLFIGSNFKLKPVEATYLRYLFRENNINVTIVQFGEEPSKYTYLLEEMIGPHKCEKSNLKHQYVFAKSNNLHLKSAVFNLLLPKDQQSAAIGLGDNVYNDNVVDDELDEELQFALKLSRDEYNQQQANVAAENPSTHPVLPGTSLTGQPSGSYGNDQEDKNDADMKKAVELGIDPTILMDLSADEREQLIMAIALSLEEVCNEDKKNEDSDKKDKTE